MRPPKIVIGISGMRRTVAEGTDVSSIIKVGNYTFCFARWHKKRLYALMNHNEDICMTNSNEMIGIALISDHRTSGSTTGNSTQQSY